MRYLISESKLDKYIIEFLNDINNNSYIDSWDNFIVLREPVDEEMEEMGDVIMEYDYSDGRLYVVHPIIEKMYSLFGLDREETYQKVGEWFANKFDVQIFLIES
jgi:hypothetical protein